MKRFKHKQTGHIATETHSEKNYKVSYPQNYTIPKWIVENSNDWEEVKEENYEILSFRSTTKDPLIVNKNEIGSFGRCVPLNRLLFGICSVEDGTWEIYSVKRLSDGEIFTIGDSIIFENFNVKVSNFNIVDGLMFVNFDREVGDLNCFGVNIIIAKKAQKPIFTTHDGVDVFSREERVYYIHHSLTVFEGRLGYVLENKGKLYQLKDYVFKYKKNAKETASKLKKVICLSDIEQAYTWDKTAPLYTQFIDNLKKIVGE